MKLLGTTFLFGLSIVADAQSSSFSGLSGSGGLSGTSNLPSVIDSDKLAFQVADIEIAGRVAQYSCPQEWSSLTACLTTKCPSFESRCPSLTGVPAHNSSALEAVDCLDIQESICFHALEPGCCLGECADALLSVSDCMNHFASVDPVQNCTGPMVCMNGTEEVTWYTEPEPELELEDEDYPLIAFMDSVDVEVSPYAAFEFGTYGTDDMLATCPNEWESFLTCVVSDCPNFVDVCSGASTAKQNAAIADFGGILRKRQLQEDSSCDDLSNDVCYLLRGDGCCLQACLPHIQTMTTCLHDAKSGLDLGSCPAIVCSADIAELNLGGDPVAVETPATPATPTTSSSTGLFSYVDSLSAPVSTNEGGQADPAAAGGSTGQAEPAATGGSTTSESSLFANDVTSTSASSSSAQEKPAAVEQTVEKEEEAIVSTSVLRRKGEDGAGETTQTENNAEAGQGAQGEDAVSGATSQNISLFLLAVVGALFFY